MPTQIKPQRTISPLQIFLETPERNESTWVNQYARWASRRSPLTPYHFHQNIALSIAAGAIAGRCYVQLPHARIYPNIYTLISALTGVYAKTTALGVAYSLINQVMPEKITNSISTPEAMINEFSGAKPTNWDSLPDEAKKLDEKRKTWGARRLFILDEAGMLFNALEKDYNATYVDILMGLYGPPDQPFERRTQTHGVIKVSNYALSCLFATTPSAIRKLLSMPDKWTNGFWARWNFVSEETATEDRDSEMAPLPRAVLETIRKVSNGWLNKYDNTPYSVAIEKKVEEEYKASARRYRKIIASKDKDERLSGILSRLPTSHMKAALISAVLECAGERPSIKLHHWEDSMELVDGWYRDAQLAMMQGQKSERITHEEKIMQLIIRSPEKATTTRIASQYLHVSAEEANRILESLAKADQIGYRMDGKRKIWLIGDRDGA